MLMETQKILTWHPAGRPGAYITKRDYNAVTDFILSALADQEISIADLMTFGSVELKGKVTGDISWSILIVKLDLEARGIITCISRLSPYRSQFLKLRPKAVKKFKAARSFRVL
jgi:hypothetical protein